MLGPVVMLALVAAPEARLEYRVDASVKGCPDERWVHAAVAARLGREPFVAEAPELVSVVISPAEAPAITAQLTVTRASGRVGKRTLDSPSGDCMELASAVELAISLALDPAVRATAVKEPEPEPEPAPAPPEPQPVVSAPPPVAVKQSTFQLRASAALLGTAGAVPGFTAGAKVGAGVAVSHFSFSLEARAHLPSGVQVDDRRIGSFLFLGSAVPCVELSPFQGCLVGSLGALQFDLGEERRTSLMAQAGARVALRFQPTKLVALSPWLEGTAVLTRTTLSLEGTPVWVTWPVSLSFGFTVELTISS